jgi:hypothetical protein
MQKQTSVGKIFESAKGLLENAGPGSKTAVIVAGHRFDESQKPEDERICYDPYAVYFVTPEIRELNKDPLKAKAILEGLGNVGTLLLSARESDILTILLRPPSIKGWSSWSSWEQATIPGRIGSKV